MASLRCMVGVALMWLATVLAPAGAAMIAAPAAPNSGMWKSLITSPLGDRSRFAAVWTGTELLVWGGLGLGCGHALYCGDGARYNAATEQWTRMSGVGAPIARDYPAAVWTGKEMLVWGGESGPPALPRGQGGDLRDGGAYDPATDRWRPLSTVGAPSQLSLPLATWTGTEMLVWGGGGEIGSRRGGAAYNPATNSWRPINTIRAPSPRLGESAIWTGTEWLIWGGNNGGSLGDGAAYNPRTDQWRPLPLAGAPSPRYEQTAVWTGTEMLVWGGATGPPPPYDHALGDGAAYSPATNTWRPLPSSGAPGPREGHSAVWTGREMLVYGGSGPNPAIRTSGAGYDPTTNQWRPIAGPGAPQCGNGDAFWTGQSMIVLPCLPFAAQYTPGTGATEPTALLIPPSLPHTGAGGGAPR